MLKISLLSATLLYSCFVWAQTNDNEVRNIEKMDQQTMESIVKEMAEEAKGEPGAIEFIVSGR